LKDLIEKQLSQDDVMYSHQALFDKHYGELKLKYDEYDTEVYYNRSKQAKWDLGGI